MFGSLKKRLSKTFSRASEIITGIGPTPAKQFRNAIIEGDEDKAISLYTSVEGEKPLCEELHPSQPFPSKKNQVSETPIYLASKYALEKLVSMLLERGGDPSLLNSQNETCAHAVCGMSDRPETRASILEVLVQWHGITEAGAVMETVSINRVNIDGNSAIHFAASKGLNSCVEKLVNYGSIISIVNRTNNTCCELADQNGFKDLAMMLELALVFQPEDADLAQFDRFAGANYTNQSSRLILDTNSLTPANLNAFIEEAVDIIAVYLDRSMSGKLKVCCRAEALLHGHNWDVEVLSRELRDDATKLLSASKMDPTRGVVVPVVEVLVSPSAAKEDNVKEEDIAMKISAGEEEDSDDLLGNIQLTLDEADLAAAADEPKAEPKAAITEELVCSICCDVMLPEQDSNYFIKHTVVDQGRHALSCLSNHTFCLDCWSSHLSVQVNENGLGYLPCAGYKCGEILDITWAPILLKTQESVNRLNTQRLRHTVDCAGLKYCPIEGCGLIVHVPTVTDSFSSNAMSSPGSNASTSGGQGVFTLPTAATCHNHHTFCVSCTQPAHSPCSCGQYPQWAQLVQQETKIAGDTLKENATGDDIANALWVAANTKRCPRCNAAIEKDEGCLHMSCRSCRKEFCWICMKDWSLHSDNTGGYFQCNRFQQEQAQAASSASPNGDEPDIWSEERGNAHAETLRLRERNRKMARFIHHFTRYQAHQQSFRLESQMSRDTFKRIEDGLKSSLEGKLKWLQGSNVPNPMVSTKQGNDLLDALSHEDMSHLKAGAFPPADGYSSPSRGKPELQVAEGVPLIAKHFIKPSPYLQFLSDGFDELLRCRQFLQWSYPYAYFEFEESDDSDYNSRTLRRQSRRAAQDHRTSFELVQADLESTVETLSDVVARRRLRASQSQIVQATRAAKQKRIEFESLLIAYSTMKQQYAMATPSSTASRSAQRTSATRASASNTSAGNNYSASRLRNVIQRSNIRSRQLQINDDENTDSLDLAALLMELEFAASMDHAPPTASRLADIDEDSELGGSDRGRRSSRNSRGTARSATTTNSQRRRTRAVRFVNNSDAASSTSNTTAATAGNDAGGGDDSGDETFSLRSALRNYGRSMGATQEIDADDEDDEDDDEDEDEETLNYLRLASTAAGGGASGAVGAPGSSTSNAAMDLSSLMNDHQLTRLARRAEEEEALNRAILMSLQYSTNAMDAEGHVRQPTEANIESLISMCFTREEARVALLETGDNVEMAANRLLGIEN